MKRVVLFMAPFAPGKSEECWNQLIRGKCVSEKDGFDRQKWPQSMVSTNTMAIIQVNGKMKKTLNLESDHCEDMSDQVLVAHLEKNEVVKNLLSFTPRDIKVIRKGAKIVINYIK